jgi:hypothetical protein
MQALKPLALLVAAALSIGANAGGIDAARPLLCASIEAADCVAGGECIRGKPESIGAPRFIWVDFERRMVTGPERSTPIKLMEQTPSQLLLQGRELEYGWSIAIARDDGAMSVTLTDSKGAFVVFGYCTAI